jgi:hypothetical protein
MLQIENGLWGGLNKWAGSRPNAHLSEYRLQPWELTHIRECCSVSSAECRVCQRIQACIGMYACSEGDGLRKPLAALRSYADYEPVNSVALRRKIAARLLSSERYTV